MTSSPTSSKTSAKKFKILNTSPQENPYLVAYLQKEIMKAQKKVEKIASTLQTML
jgi:translation initiation factor 2 beta subunit (eIF-2beta)/eIF-5